LSERLDARQTSAKTIFAFYAYIYHWSKYLRTAAQPLLYGYQIGMETGEVEAAMFDLGHHLMNGMITGSSSLARLSEQMKNACQKMKDYQQGAIRSFVLSLWQMALNLLGQSGDPLVLTGEAMNEEETLKTVLETGNIMLEVWLYSLKMQLMYLLGDYHQALEFAKKAKEYVVKIYQGEPLVPRHTFFSGLVWIEKGNARQGKKILKKMKKWVQNGNVNCLHQVQHLEAELAHLRGEKDVAKQMYNASILSAGKGSFINDKALAHERAGLFHLKSDDDTYWAAYHFNCSIEAYQNWSATIKVRQLIQNYGDILSEHGYHCEG
jgi:tetratricopeptide (TPR) repeat protein